jgi:hypothetical protein
MGDILVFGQPKVTAAVILFQKSLFKNDKEGFWPNDGQKRVWYIVENITAVSALEPKTNAP